MINVSFDKEYLLAVSGGADSMAMLHMFMASKANITVVTIDHQLRAESASECDMVSNYCSVHGVKCYKHAVDVKGYCLTNKVSVELGARQLRQGIFAQYQCDYICTAHNSDDSVESIIHNMVRGSGASGIMGIPQYRDRYYRPVLEYTKQQLLDYCHDNDVPYVTDSSNLSTDYTRNYIRHEIIPLLNNINSQANIHILALASSIASDCQYIDSQLDKSLITLSNGTVSIDKQLFNCHNSLVIRGIKYALTLLVGNSVDFTSKHYNDIISLNRNFGGKMLCLPFDIFAYNDYNKVSLVVGKDNCSYSFELPFVGQQIDTPLGVVFVTNTKPSEPSLMLDLSAVPSGSVIRTIRQGDKFTKFGGGTKAVSRYLADIKVAKRDRDKLLVLANGDNVLAIVGIEISQLVRVENNSHASYIYLQ